FPPDPLSSNDQPGPALARPPTPSPRATPSKPIRQRPSAAGPLALPRCQSHLPPAAGPLALPRRRLAPAPGRSATRRRPAPAPGRPQLAAAAGVHPDTGEMDELARKRRQLIGKNPCHPRLFSKKKKTYSLPMGHPSSDLTPILRPRHNACISAPLLAPASHSC
uniref:Uncharacterized protein n=1 Tax=Aegilops tauschii subsp. strangulata TaxID=200361 RepID=A0A453C3M9_AEGTS